MIKILDWFFGKKYVEWDEYKNKIRTIDDVMFKKEVESENKRILNMSS